MILRNCTANIGRQPKMVLGILHLDNFDNVEIPLERQGGGHSGSPPSMVPGGEWRGSLSGEEMGEEETSETVGQWKMRPDGRKTRSIYSVKQSWAKGRFKRRLFWCRQIHEKYNLCVVRETYSTELDTTYTEMLYGGFTWDGI